MGKCSLAGLDTGSVRTAAKFFLLTPRVATSESPATAVLALSYAENFGACAFHAAESGAILA